MSSVAALGLVGALALYRSASGGWDSRWPLVLILVATAGTGVGYGGRVLTAGVAGANQGAGVMVLLGGPVVVGLLATAAVRSYRILRH